MWQKQYGKSFPFPFQFLQLFPFILRYNFPSPKAEVYSFHFLEVNKKILENTWTHGTPARKKRSIKTAPTSPNLRNYSSYNISQFYRRKEYLLRPSAIGFLLILFYTEFYSWYQHTILVPPLVQYLIVCQESTCVCCAFLVRVSCGTFFFQIGARREFPEARGESFDVAIYICARAHIYRSMYVQ